MFRSSGSYERTSPIMVECVLQLSMTTHSPGSIAVFSVHRHTATRNSESTRLTGKSKATRTTFSSTSRTARQ